MPARPDLGSAQAPLLRCGPLIDTSVSWLLGPVAKVKKRVLKPWHWLPP
jgi:hypothetical protein